MPVVPATSSRAHAALLLGPYPFTFATANLNAGVAFYTPTPGDVLLDFLISVPTAFNGTTPQGDLGSFLGGDTAGWLSVSYGAWPMTRADNRSGPPNETARAVSFPTTAQDAGLPMLFTAANPIKFVVSQDGTAGGAATGATQGAANIYLLVATPGT